MTKEELNSIKHDLWSSRHISGSNYHFVLKKALLDLIKLLEKDIPDIETRNPYDLSRRGKRGVSDA